jgi:N-dimethylarginine dimethylaminohydrolase
MLQNPRQKHILMCAPDHFGVAYVINPWMEGQFATTRADVALEQWTQLKQEIERHAMVSLLPPRKSLPDLVFTANAGLVKGKKALVSRFRCAERRGEEIFDRLWFETNGFFVLDPPPGTFFEGAGDALYDETRDLFWVGSGFRSDSHVAPLLQALLVTRAVGLSLVDPRFYHLDTCLSPLPNGFLMYFPNAFDAPSRSLIETLVPEDRRIIVAECDALKFCCNAVALNDHVIMNDASDALTARLRAAGLIPVLTPLGEFLKAGGAAKCLTLNL